MLNKILIKLGVKKEKKKRCSITKKPYKPLMVHRVCIAGDDVNIKGRRISNNRTLLVEKVGHGIFFEEYVDRYISKLKEQIPDTIEKCEHIFLPCIIDDYISIDKIEKPADEKMKSIIFIDSINSSLDQTDEEYAKKLRKFIVKNLDNALDYFEIFVQEDPGDSMCCSWSVMSFDDFEGQGIDGYHSCSSGCYFEEE